MKFLVEITENGFTKVSPVPARFGIGEAASLLGISKTDLGHLCSIKQLDILGDPQRNQEKFLCAEDVLSKARDKQWLGKVTDLLYAWHSQRNGS